MIDEIRVIVDDIMKAGDDRSFENAPRRLCKVLEETGELAEAILNVTCALNYKNKLVEDIHEEAVDCLIVLVDCALTQLPYSRYSAGALIVQDIEEGRIASIEVKLEDIENMLFDISAAVSRAASSLKQKSDMGYYGSLATAIRIAAMICFAPLQHDADKVFDQVSEIMANKLNKWRNFRVSKEKVEQNASI